MINFSINLGAKEIKLLRLKPSINKAWYKQNKLNIHELNIFYSRYQQLKKKYRNFIQLDTAFCFIFKNKNREELKQTSTFGCLAADRSCAIDADGLVYPCPFFKNANYCAGNIFENDFSAIWNNSEKLNQFRYTKLHLTGKCAQCQNNQICFGCRKVALEETKKINSADPDCIKLFK